MYKNRGMKREKQLLFLGRTKRAGFVTSSRAALGWAIRRGSGAREHPQAIPGVIGLGLDPGCGHC